jgi:quercetin dioxygenase-like cupin family protein
MNKFNFFIVACFAILITACSNSSTNKKATVMENSNEPKLNTIFPKGEPASNDYFVGTAYVDMLMTNTDDFDCSIGNVTFEPGCRNSWHSHAGGQLLLVTAGEGYYQEKGKPIQLIKKGDVIEIKPNVVHWHGATPDSPMEHLAIGTRNSAGSVTWLEPVTDEEYLSYQK